MSAGTTDADPQDVHTWALSEAVGGTVALLDGTSVAEFTPAQDAHDGTDSFSFVANDGQVDSNEATVTVTVQPAQVENRAPVAESQDVEVAENGAVASKKRSNSLSREGVKPQVRAGSGRLMRTIAMESSLGSSSRKTCLS